MEIIKNNPFRILGLLSNATERDILRQKSKIQAHLNVGKNINLAFDLPLFGELKRNQDSLSLALSQLESDLNKVQNALFWMINHSSYDQIALDHMKNGDHFRAKDIWAKVTGSKQINAQNISATLNLSTIIIFEAFIGNDIDFRLLSSGLAKKLQLVNSAEFGNFVHSFAGQNFKASKDKLSEFLISSFSDELLKRYKNGNESTFDSIHELYQDIEVEYADLLKKYLSQEYFNIIENEISKAQEKRKLNAKDSIPFADNLVRSTEESYNLLVKILGRSNFRFRYISDKLALEILQCGIDYFKAFEDSSTDPSSESLRLFKKANSIAIGALALDRIKENTEGISEWIATKDERDKNKKIRSEMDAIQSLILNIDSYDTAKEAVLKGKNYLKKIKKILGRKDEVYIELSSHLVMAILGFTIPRVNKIQSDFKPSNYQGYGPQISFIFLQEEVNSSMELLNLLERFKMSPEVKSHYWNNNQILKSILKSIDPKSSNIRMDLISRRIVQGIFLVLIVLFFGGRMLLNSIQKTSKNTATVPEVIESPIVDTSAVVVSESEKPVETDDIIGQLNNGDSPLDNCFGQGVYYGNAYITFRNSNNFDAIVCLVSLQTGKTIRNEYIRAGTDFNMSSIPAGTYYLKVFYGNDWNPKIKNPCGTPGYFEQDAHFSKSDRPSDYIQIRNDAGGYTTGEITLYTVAGGNMDQKRISEDEFFK